MKKEIKTDIILILIFLAGLSLLLYPSFANYWNSFHATQAIANYTEQVIGLDSEVYEKMYSEALEYNADLARRGSNTVMSDEQRIRYEATLDVTGTGIMGYIEIEDLNVNLPIYHGTGEGVLQIAVGHLDWSSLPVGGESTHCVLSGHRGLPSAKLFTDLDQLREGDTFTITVLDEVLTYEVDQIRIVEPEMVSDLNIDEGEDYCTLVTCTPYGINTHRLLVRGHRVETVNKSDIRVVSEAVIVEPLVVAPVLAVPLLIITLILLLSKKPKEKKRSENRR